MLGSILEYRLHMGPQLARLQQKLAQKQNQEAGPPPGQWGRVQLGFADIELDSYQKTELDRLRSLGYAGGSQPPDGSSQVTFHAPEYASQGARYYASGHAPAAFLMDVNGQVLHRWQLSYQETLDLSRDKGHTFLPDKSGATACWRRVRLMPEGHLLAIFEGHGLIYLDKDSRLIWAYSGHCHHDLDLGPDGDIYVLTREAKILPHIHPTEPVLLDYICHLSPTGEFLDRIDILAAFAESVYASCLNDMAPGGDILHTNTIERLDGSLAHLSPVFAEGNFLISVRELDTVAIIDGITGKVVWALDGMWTAQHEPTMLADGNMLIFDNKGCRGQSKALEFDPLTQEVVWSYEGLPGNPLYSATCGAARRLPGGNTFITESDNGRALEVTPAGDIVWEFHNPRRAGQNQEFIAAILDMVVLPEDHPQGWLNAISDK